MANKGSWMKWFYKTKVAADNNYKRLKKLGIKQLDVSPVKATHGPKKGKVIGYELKAYIVSVR